MSDVKIDENGDLIMVVAKFEADACGDIIERETWRRAAQDFNELANEREKCACPGVLRKGCPCSRCHGTGWYPESIEGDEYGYNECYCDCDDGKRLRERD